jgi:hypothetical protein
MNVFRIPGLTGPLNGLARHVYQCILMYINK